jgi:class 3 adenylate cyclase/tetratricopeptide (TPR) repeat protein
MTLICPACGAENPERARFCNACAALLVDASEPREERKIVSVLFVDLVGFTGRSDNADPEDMRAVLRPYHARMQHEIERFGGTVEKFVGDAVMAVFGAPAAHEDDAERAVRAALRILESIDELNESTPGLELAVRAAVNTGEAVVSLAARAERGESVATGDVVNTAARLQGAAPTGGVVVGESTYRATRQAVEYADAEPVTVKGKAAPLRIWRAVGARSRLGLDLERAERKPFVGRDDDLALLTSTFVRATRERSAQLVTVTGEPGVGKTRLITELRRFVDDRPELVTWRQGRCLPYGDGITYWALGEIVKAHAGILESDSADEVTAKLERALDAIASEVPERDWLQAQLAPLVGLVASEDGSRDEVFTAWRRFLEGIASDRPAVLVFEDLHWADAALVDFIEQLVDRSSDVSLLVVCSGRPELYERHPSWGGGKRNSTTISLAPLTPTATSELLAALLRQAVLPAETQTALLERCGGNPLYAEEFVRMLTDRGVLSGRAAITADTAIPLPESVQALIAARIDTLPPDRKALLHDAAVIGKVFWAGAVAAMADVDPAVARDALHDLARKELVRPARSSSVRDETEFSFWHVLVRDVAYAQIPRAARARKHEAAARWIEQMAGTRVGDHAELLAYHYERALELTRAAREPRETPSLQRPARKFLFLAGERARHLDRPTAENYYRRALSLDPEGAECARLLLAHSDVVEDLRVSEAEQREALELFRAAGDELGAAETMSELSRTVWLRGRAGESDTMLQEAIRTLEGRPPGAQLLQAYVRKAGREAVGARPHAAIAMAERGLELATRLGDDLHVGMLRTYLGVALCELGDVTRGLDELRAVLELELGRGFGENASIAYSNLGSLLLMAEGAAAALPVHEEGIAFSKKRGLSESFWWLRGERTWMLYDLGRWDDLLADADALLEDVAAASRETSSAQVRTLVKSWQAHVLLRRGDHERAGALIDESLGLAREVRDAQILGPTLAAAAIAARRSGDVDAAVALVDELDGALAGRAAWHRARFLPDLVDICVAAGASGKAAQLVDSIDVLAGRTQHGVDAAHALLAEKRSDHGRALQLYGTAADGWEQFSFRLGRAEALLGAGRCLLALGRADEARTPLADAREIFAALRARPSLAEVDALLDDGSLQARA